MKIMLSDATLAHGGAERVVSILGNCFVEMGHEVEIFLFYDREIWYNLDKRIKVTVDEKILGKANIFKHIFFRRKHIIDEKPDVVISFLAPFNMIMTVAMLGLKIPLIVADRNDPKKVPKRFIWRKLRDFIYLFADGIVLQNETNKGYFSRAIQNKSAVIYNPINLGDLTGAGLIAKKEKKIVSVGRLIEQKNPELLLDAFVAISKRYPEYKLFYYGDGELKETLRDKARTYGVEERVFLPGSVKDVISEICNAEVFVMTSWYEGMSNALMEAMCVGIPPICTEVSGAKELIKSGESGLLFDCGSKEQLIKCLDELLSNTERRRDMAVAASSVANILDVSVIIEQWYKFIRRIVER